MWFKNEDRKEALTKNDEFESVRNKYFNLEKFSVDILASCVRGTGLYTDTEIMDVIFKKSMENQELE